MKGKANYPQRKVRELTNEVKSRIRDAIETEKHSIYTIASAFDCSTSQVAGLKAWLKRLKGASI